MLYIFYAKRFKSFKPKLKCCDLEALKLYKNLRSGASDDNFYNELFSVNNKPKRFSKSYGKKLC